MYSSLGRLVWRKPQSPTGTPPTWDIMISTKISLTLETKLSKIFCKNVVFRSKTSPIYFYPVGQRCGISSFANMAASAVKTSEVEEVATLPPSMQEYIIHFAQAHESFRKPELESLAKLHNIELKILHYTEKVREMTMENVALYRVY